MKKIIEIDKDHLKTLGSCGGFYSCPKSADGNRFGPLVGYAGKYAGPAGAQLQFVGDIYANFAKAEQYSFVLRHFAVSIVEKLYDQIGLQEANVFCGAPIGGYSLATALGLVVDAGVRGIRVVKAEKKVTVLATPTSREKSELVFARHSIVSGESVVVVEDVCNNYSTTEELVRLIIAAGGRVVAIACFLNRSLTVDAEYSSRAAGCNIPVISLVRLPINEWKQDDPAVAEDVANGNVVWKPKDEWSRLMDAMKRHEGFAS